MTVLTLVSSQSAEEVAAYHWHSAVALWWAFVLLPTPLAWLRAIAAWERVYADGVRYTRERRAA